MLIQMFQMVKKAVYGRQITLDVATDPKPQSKFLFMRYHPEIWTAKIINFSFVPYGKLMVLVSQYMSTLRYYVAFGKWCARLLIYTIITPSKCKYSRICLYFPKLMNAIKSCTLIDRVVYNKETVKIFEDF